MHLVDRHRPREPAGLPARARASSRRPATGSSERGHDRRRSAAAPRRRTRRDRSSAGCRLRASGSRTCSDARRRAAGTKISHTPLEPSARIGCTRPSQPLKSPTTLTRWALGAQTAKWTPSAPPMRSGCAPSLVVDPGVVPFAEQIEIEVGDDAAEPVGIVELGPVPVRVGHAQAIVGDVVHAFEQSPRTRRPDAWRPSSPPARRAA